MDETFSSIDLVTQCLTDEKRTKAFREAIERQVRPGDIVLDAGTGSGILALFAARAGAKKVVAVEFDPFVARLAQKNFEQNGFGDVIQLITGDVRTLTLTEPIKFDVVIMEMLTTGMIDEYQVWAINNLHQRGYVHDATKFIPAIQETKVALSWKNFDIEGLHMQMIRHLWEPFPTGEMSELTERVVLNNVSFGHANEANFTWEHTFSIINEGVVNSVYLTSVSILGGGISISDTLSLNAPVVIPLTKDLSVKKGDSVVCKIQYQFGNGFRNFVAETVLL